MGEVDYSILDALARLGLLALTAALVYFTKKLWKSTETLGEANERMAVATEEQAKATTKRTRLDYQSRLNAEWSIAAGRDGYVPRFEIWDERGLPMNIDNIYMTVAPSGPDEGDEVRPERVEPIRYRLSRRTEERISLPATVCVAVRSTSVCVGAIHYRDLATDTSQVLEVITGLSIDNAGKPAWSPYKFHNRNAPDVKGMMESKVLDALGDKTTEGRRNY